MSQIKIMAVRHSAFYSPLLLTMAGGFLKQQGFDAVYTVETPDNKVADNLLKGSCDLAQSAVATSFVAAEKGVYTDIVHFAQINQRDGFFIAGRKPEPDFCWDRLIGKKVLVDHFFQPYAMLKYGLFKQGIDMSQLLAIDAGDVKQMEQRFRSGEGDYVQLQGPAPQQMEHEGLASVVAAVGDAVGPVAFSSLCARRDWLTSEMANAFKKAYQQSMDFVIGAPAEEIAALQHQFGFFPEIDRTVLAKTIAAYQKLGCWQKDITISRDCYDNLIKVFRFNNSLSRDYRYEEFIA